VQVRNEGEVRVPNGTLTVSWPYAVKVSSDDDQGKHVLYLMHEPVLVSLMITFYILINYDAEVY